MSENHVAVKHGQGYSGSQRNDSGVNEMTAIDDLPLTVSVPVFGRVVYNLGRNASYDAAKLGQIPTIQIGGVKRVPVRVALRPLIADGADIGALLARFRELENVNSEAPAAA
jgi:hypothetical protein